MLFNSQALILGLLPIALAGWYLAPTRTVRQWWGVAASLVFYAFWDVRFVPLLAGLTLGVVGALPSAVRCLRPTIPVALKAV